MLTRVLAGACAILVIGIAVQTARLSSEQDESASLRTRLALEQANREVCTSALDRQTVEVSRLGMVADQARVRSDENEKIAAEERAQIARLSARIRALSVIPEERATCPAILTQLHEVLTTGADQ